MKLDIKQLIFSAAIVTLGISSALAMKPDIVSEKEDVTSDDFFIVGKNENGEYKILIPSELMKVSILFKKAKMAESSTKEITAPEEVEESDIRSFFTGLTQ